MSEAGDGHLQLLAWPPLKIATVYFLLCKFLVLITTLFREVPVN